MTRRRWCRVTGVRLLDAVRWPHRIPATPDHALRALIRELDDAPPLRGQVAVLAMRSGTWFEFAAYAACWFRKLGYGTVLLYSGRDLERMYGAGSRWFERFFAGAFPRLMGRIPDIRLCNVDEWRAETAGATPEQEAWAVSYGSTAAAYDLRVEEHDGHPVAAEYRRLADDYRNRLLDVRRAAETNLRTLMARPGIRRLVAYSGLIGDTPAFAEAARACGLDAVFCEGWAVRAGHMICSFNHPAMTYDVAAWFACLDRLGDTAYLRDVESFLHFQETNDTADAEWLRTYHKFQRTASGAPLPDELKRFLHGAERVFLLAPNCVGDSATLRVETCFRNQSEWLRQVCGWFAAHPAMRLIVRAHPDELKLVGSDRLRIRMGDEARRLAAGLPNVYVIEGTDALSSYALLPHVQAGLVWMSTIGVDMAIRGIPVAAAARPKYSGLGIVEEPQTPEAYLQCLDRLAAGRERPSDAQRLTGKKYLAVLAREFSYEAFTDDYRLHDLTVAGHAVGGEADTFYRMLCGVLDVPTRPASRACGAA
jgi:hypothetical protein